MDEIKSVGRPKKNKDIPRGRNWAFTIYEDSCPQDWRDIIQSWYCEAFVIWHDKDINPDGVPKKKHAHVMVMFEGLKSFEQIQDLSNQLSGVLPIRLESKRGYARYLLHLDNPEKYQYNRDEIISFCGADFDQVSDYVEDLSEVISDMVAFCRLNRIILFADLVEYARHYDLQWFKILYGRATMFFTNYMKACQYAATHPDLAITEFVDLDGCKQTLPRLQIVDQIEVKEIVMEDDPK